MQANNNTAVKIREFLDNLYSNARFPTWDCSFSLLFLWEARGQGQLQNVVFKIQSQGHFGRSNPAVVSVSVCVFFIYVIKRKTFTIITTASATHNVILSKLKYSPNLFCIVDFNF